LLSGKNWGTENIGDICAMAAEESCLNYDQMCSYFDGLVYDLGPEEQKGMRAFYASLVETGIIDEAPELEFLP